VILKAADGTVYKVHFRHWLPAHERGRRLGRAEFPYLRSYGLRGPFFTPAGGVSYVSYQPSPMTECFLHKHDCRMHPQQCLAAFAEIPKDQLKDAVVTQARCSPRDEFKKSTGRLVALGRALKALVPDARTRAELLADYERRLRPRCNHRHKDGSPMWQNFEGVSICPRCMAKRDLPVE
jgi:hypothetical protein